MASREHFNTQQPRHFIRNCLWTLYKVVTLTSSICLIGSTSLNVCLLAKLPSIYRNLSIKLCPTLKKEIRKVLYLFLFLSGSTTAIGDIIRKCDFILKRSQPLKNTLTKAKIANKGSVGEG